MDGIFEIFLQNCVVASGFFILLCLVKPVTEKHFSQRWHYLAMRVNLLLFFIPISPICEKFAPYLAKLFPKAVKNSDTIQPEQVIDFYFPTEYFSPDNQGTVGFEVVEAVVNEPINWLKIFLTLWLIGSIVVGLWQIYCRIRLHRELKPLNPLKNEEIEQILSACKKEKNIKKRISLFTSHKMYSPLLMGLLQAKILFPTKNLEEKHLKYVFSHELTHYKRGDLWWKALLTPLSVLFWWNPLLYYFMAQFELCLEYSCDEEVVKNTSIRERKHYGLAILESIDEKKQGKMKLLGVSLRTPEQKLERRLNKMLNLKEMKSRTKVLSGVLMSALLLGAALPSLAGSVSEAQETYEDRWDMPTKKALSVNSLVSVNSEDEKNFTEEEWAEIMERVEAGTIKYVEITEEHRELEALLKKHDIPPFLTSAPNELPLPSLTVGEKLELFQYYVENDCTGSLHCNGDLNAITGEYEITISCYNSEGDLIVSNDLGVTWEVKDHIMGGSSRILDDMKLSGQALDITPSIVETSAFLMEGTDNGEDWEEILADNPDIQSFDVKIIAVSPEDESKFTSDQWAEILGKVESGEIQMLEPDNENHSFSQGILVEPTDTVELEGMQHPLRDSNFYFSGKVYDNISYYAAEEGTKIYPSEKGTVIESGFEINAGNQVVILHEDGSKTQYRHCKDLFVSVGDEVGLDDVLGTVGKTGNVTGFALGFCVI